jgi:hypothetical protein
LGDEHAPSNQSRHECDAPLRRRRVKPVQRVLFEHVEEHASKLVGVYSAGQKLKKLLSYAADV